MLVEQLSTVDNSIVIGSVALLTCVVFIIVAVLNSVDRGENDNLNSGENIKNEPEVITQQPTTIPTDDCCLFFHPSGTSNFVYCGDCGCSGGDCCCTGCECCAGCDACTGCDLCIGCDGLFGCGGCLEACCSGGCEACTPELCCVGV
ncbi:GSCOCG00009741001-RA-CDS [Cotesia congregata]|uniref:Uncharacterized protein n=1 Tax=Cotesia congregata TaxID=51543 RepID=A0A8J2EFY2_COTCN|nr:GSCOCG00009741001-RA-CDS [Cotesia congregata]CAG5074024.1 Protein of unknown function [Cotesia congregata]